MRHKYFYFICLLLLTVPALNANAARLSVIYMGSSSGVSFSGYAGPFDGNLGGIKGANQKCVAAFAESHICTYDEIIRLANSYTYANSVWFIDGLTSTSDGYPTSKLGGGGGLINGSGTCSQWSVNSGTFNGYILSTAGTSSLLSCGSTAYLACCK